MCSLLGKNTLACASCLYFEYHLRIEREIVSHSHTAGGYLSRHNASYRGVRCPVLREPSSRVRGHEGTHAADTGEPGGVWRPEGDDVRVNMFECGAVKAATPV